MRIRTLRAATALFFVTSGMLSLGLVWISMAGIRIPPLTGEFRSLDAHLSGLDIGSGLPAEAPVFDEALARPLFEQTRRPFVQPQTPSVIETAPPPQLAPTPPMAPSDINGVRLAGVFLSDTRKSALIQTPENPAGEWLGQGEEISGWRVDRISPGQVTLQFNDRISELKLYVDEPANPVDQQE